MPKKKRGDKGVQVASKPPSLVRSTTPVQRASTPPTQQASAPPPVQQEITPPLNKNKKARWKKEHDALTSYARFIEGQSWKTAGNVRADNQGRDAQEQNLQKKLYETGIKKLTLGDTYQDVEGKRQKLEAKGAELKTDLSDIRRSRIFNEPIQNMTASKAQRLLSASAEMKESLAQELAARKDKRAIAQKIREGADTPENRSSLGRAHMEATESRHAAMESLWGADMDAGYALTTNPEKRVPRAKKRAAELDRRAIQVIESPASLDLAMRAMGESTTAHERVKALEKAVVADHKFRELMPERAIGYQRMHKNVEGNKALLDFRWQTQNSLLSQRVDGLTSSESDTDGEDRSDYPEEKKTRAQTDISRMPSGSDLFQGWNARRAGRSKL